MQNSDDRLVASGITKPIAWTLAILSVAVVAIAIWLDLRRWGTSYPIGSNLIAALFAIPPVTLAAWLIIDRSLRSQEERRLARTVYLSARRLSIRTRGLRLAIHHAYLGEDQATATELDADRTYGLLKQLEDLRRATQDLSMNVPHQPAVRELTEVQVRLNIVIECVEAFLGLLAGTPFAPMLQFSMGIELDRLKYHVRQYEVYLAGQYDDETASAARRRAADIEQAVLAFCAAISLSNEARRAAETAAIRFKYAYFEEDPTTQQEADKEVSELLRSAHYIVKEGGSVEQLFSAKHGHIDGN